MSMRNLKLLPRLFPGVVRSKNSRTGTLPIHNGFKWTISRANRQLLVVSKVTILSAQLFQLVADAVERGSPTLPAGPGVHVSGEFAERARRGVTELCACYWP